MSPNRIRVTANIGIAKRLYEIDNRIPVSKSERSCDNRNVKKSPPKKPEQLLSTLLVHLFLELDLR